MNNEIQKLIINLLGIIAITALIEILILIRIQPQLDITIIVALVGLVNAITGGLIGFLTGKAIYEPQQVNSIPETEPTEAIIGSKQFESKEDLEDYINNHTVQELMDDADDIETITPEEEESC